MAFTVSYVGNSVFGNKQVKFIRVTTDSAENKIDSGLAVIECFSYAPQSMSTNGGKFFINQGTTGTALNGFIGISAAVSGDVFFLTVFGH